MAVFHANIDNFNEVEKSEKRVLIDFYADWCGPCRMVAPIVHEIAEERGDIKVGKVNVDEEPELAEKFGVFSIPMLVVMKDGKIVNQSLGARPKEIILDEEDDSPVEGLKTADLKNGLVVMKKEDKTQ